MSFEINEELAGKNVQDKGGRALVRSVARESTSNGGGHVHLALLKDSNSLRAELKSTNNISALAEPSHNSQESQGFKDEQKNGNSADKYNTKDGISKADLKPRVAKDQYGRPINFVTDNKTVVEYRYRNDKSKTPDTIVINGQFAWVPANDGQSWYRWERKDGQWVTPRPWQGTMGTTEAGEFTFTPKGEDSVTWTQRGGGKTSSSNGSSQETFNGRVVKVTHADGSAVESTIENSKPVKYIETFKNPDGNLEKVTWTKNNSSDTADNTSITEWESAKGKRHNLQLTDKGAFVYTETDGTQHHHRKDGSQSIYNPKTKSTIEVHRGGDLASIRFGDGTLREFGWKHNNGDGPNQKELISVKVTSLDKSVSKWDKIAPDRWLVNGKEQSRLRFDLSGDKYTYHNLDNDLRIERDFSGSQRWLQSIQDPKGGASKEIIYTVDTKGNPQSISDSISGKNWLREGNNWRSGSEICKGELEIEKNQYAFFDKKSGDRIVFKNDGNQETEKGLPEGYQGYGGNLKNFIASILPSNSAKRLSRCIDNFETKAIAEGASPERLTKIYNRVSEKLTAAQKSGTLEKCLNQIQTSDLKFRPLLFERTVNCSEQHANRVEEQLNKIPLPLRQILLRKGYTLVASDTLIEAMPKLKDVQPRGWPPSLTWQSAEGAQDYQVKMIVISDKKLRDNQLVTVDNERFMGVLRHELGHAFDYSIDGRELFSDSSEFIAAYNEDVGKIPSEMLQELEYYLQAVNKSDKNRGSSAGRSETAADIIALLLGSPCNAWRAELLQRHFPNVIYVAERKLQEAQEPYNIIATRIK